MHTLARVNFRTHLANIAQNHSTGSIVVFKSTKHRCDFEVFDCSEAASEYVLTPFPDHYYAVQLDDDTPDQ
jgi:hypothetical protein